jgi:hypothetical protein
MRLDHFLAQRDCVQCPSSPPVCSCGSSQVCIQIAQYALYFIFRSYFFFDGNSRSCDLCATFQCEDRQLASSSGRGISAGVVAGTVVGSLIFLLFSLAAFIWWRRRIAAAAKPTVAEVKDIPAPADTVLNRPDPTEKVVVTSPPTTSPAPAPAPAPASVVRVYGNETSTINLDPGTQAPDVRRDSSQSNPFGDAHSIQTTSTGSQSTNVIPIAFVPPPASVLPVRSSPSPQASSMSMAHDPHLPSADLNMEHMNLSVDSVPLNSSIPSGVVMADNRSYVTNASYASDVLSEVPTIVTGRQIASAAKAAVVSASTTKSLTARPSVRSPLTASSFGPQDILHEAEESHQAPAPLNPFADQRSPAIRSSMATQGSSQPAQDIDTTAGQHPWNAGIDIIDPDRPLSTITQAASVIGANIMDATRVHLGFAQPGSASVYSPAPSVGAGLVRMASGRLVSPFTPSGRGPLERQQESAITNVQARRQQSEKAPANPQRISMSTMASGMSGRADSILESFTFVPPSPISNRPPRTPPRSPLAQETTHVTNRTAAAQDDVLDPPDRRVVGMSTGSQLSSMSTGLGSFPFQIDHGGEGNQSEEPPVGVLPHGQVVDKVKQRASLDTLALTKDLTSYPLGFDRQSKESFAAFMPSKS